MAPPSAAALNAARQHSHTPAARARSSGAAASAAAAAAAIGGCEDGLTTKLLADSTSASACGIMGLLQQQQPPPRVGLLHTTIAGGAPVLQSAAAAGRVTPRQQQQEYGTGDEGGARAFEGMPFDDRPVFGAASTRGAIGAGAAGAHQQQYEMSPELGSKPAAAGLADADVIECSQPDAAEEAAADMIGEEPSPVEHWNRQQQQQGASAAGWQRATPARVGSSPLAQTAMAGAAAAAIGKGGVGQEGDESTLELAAGVSQGAMTLQGLEDATIEDFALPPDMPGGGAAADERPITMPFSGWLVGDLSNCPFGTLDQVSLLPGNSSYVLAHGFRFQVEAQHLLALLCSTPHLPAETTVTLHHV